MNSIDLFLVYPGLADATGKKVATLYHALE